MCCSSHKTVFELLTDEISLNGNYKWSKTVDTGRRALSHFQDVYMTTKHWVRF